MVEAFLVIEIGRETSKVGLQINKVEIKYLTMSRSGSNINPQNTITSKMQQTLDI